MTNFSRLSPLQLLFKPLAQGVAPQIDRHDPALPIQQQVVRDGPDVEPAEQRVVVRIVLAQNDMGQRLSAPVRLNSLFPAVQVLVDGDRIDRELLPVIPDGGQQRRHLLTARPAPRHDAQKSSST